jgi:hypothetical protein
VGGRRVRDDGYLTVRRLPGRAPPLFDQQLEGNRVTLSGAEAPCRASWRSARRTPLAVVEQRLGARGLLTAVNEAGPFDDVLAGEWEWRRGHVPGRFTTSLRSHLTV